MPMLEEEARARHRELAGRPSSNGGNISTVSDRGKARDHAAKMLKTSPRYVQDAKTIKEHAPELPKVFSLHEYLLQCRHERRLHVDVR
jgi:hypothetical protein